MESRGYSCYQVDGIMRLTGVRLDRQAISFRYDSRLISCKRTHSCAIASYNDFCASTSPMIVSINERKVEVVR